MYDLGNEQNHLFPPLQCIFYALCLLRNCFRSLNFNYPEKGSTCYFLIAASTRTLCQNATSEVKSI